MRKTARELPAFNAEEVDQLRGLEVARRAVDIAEELQATDIVLLDLGDLSSFTDYFVICSATSDRHLQAIADELQRKLKEDGVLPLFVEGTVESGWVVLDYSDVIVHLFTAEQREYYRLEQVWQKAVPVVRIQ
ncbi:MAG: ribosome silencing factor [Chloroflexota bacterium]|nr:MAG: ribosome silencing factor [Chloroflexota bacterium]